MEGHALPAEIVEHIFQLADTGAVRVAGTTCSAWRRAAARVLKQRGARRAMTTHDAMQSTKMLQFSGMFERAGAERAFVLSCRQLHTAKLFVESYFGDAAVPRQLLSAAVCEACGAGSFDAVRWLVEKFRSAGLKGESAMHAACVNGHTEVASWVLETLGVSLSYVENEWSEPSAIGTMLKACAMGHINTARWVATEFGISQDELCSTDIAEEMGRENRADSLRGLVAFVDEDRRRGVRSKATAGACARGNMQLAEEMAGAAGYEGALAAEDVEDVLPEVLEEICAEGRLPALHWVARRFGLPPARQHLFAKAAECGHLDVAKFLAADGVSPECVAKAAKRASLFGRTGVLRWLTLKYGLAGESACGGTKPDI